MDTNQLKPRLLAAYARWNVAIATRSTPLLPVPPQKLIKNPLRPWPSPLISFTEQQLVPSNLILLLPLDVLTDHIIPLLSIVDFLSLLATSKSLTVSHCVPLTDLSFARFGCTDHSLFTRTFYNGFPSPTCISGGAPILCETCSVEICANARNLSTTGLMAYPNSGYAIAIYSHYCEQCSVVCNACLQGSSHSDCRECSTCGYLSSPGYCESCQEGFCVDCDSYNTCEICDEDECEDCVGELLSGCECGVYMCRDHEEMAHCEGCGRSACDDCGGVAWCDGCETVHCSDGCH